MTKWKFVALDGAGKRQTGVVPAANQGAVEAFLAEKRWIPVQLDELQTTEFALVKEGGRRWFRPGPKAADATALLRSIAVMTAAGIPLAETLEGIAENPSSDAVRMIAQQMNSEIMQGRSLSQALRSHPALFPEIICEMVAVSDDTGRLNESLQMAVDFLETNQMVRKNVMGALTYPCILMGASLVSFLLLLVVILPTFNEAFSSMGVKMPVFTEILLRLGLFLRSNLLWLGIVGIVLGVIGKIALRQPAAKRYVALAIAHFPVIGNLQKHFALNRAMRTFAALTEARIPIVDAIGHASRVARHPYLTPAFEVVKLSVKNGVGLADAMSSTKQFPGLIIQMVGSGERSGRLAELVARAVEHGESELERKIKAAVSLLEPIVIVGMGLIVGAITISILMPLFSMSNMR